MGWFQVERAPPIVLAAIFCPALNGPSSFFIFWNCPSTIRLIPILDPQFVSCLIATALTPLLIPLIPSRLRMSRKMAKVETLVPASLWRVTSTVCLDGALTVAFQ